MASGTTIYEFTAWAKICSSRLAYKYVKGLNVGKDMSEMLDKLLLLNRYIKVLENYNKACCSEFIFQGRKHLKSGHVILSKKNSLLLKSEEEKIRLDSDTLNCITMKDICTLAENIRSICINC
jgi:hypothetical protein